MKSAQERLTLDDTLFYQNKLRDLLQRLTEYNRPLLETEREEYFEMLSKSLISQGSSDPVSLVLEGGWFVYASVQSLALRLADLTTPRVSLKTMRPDEVSIVVDIKVLWGFLYSWVVYLFPKACAEAWHISAESPVSQKAGTYSFSSREKLEKRS